MSSKPTPFTFQNEEYYCLKELKEYTFEYFINNKCKSDYKNIIEKKQLQEHIIYVSKKED